MTEQSFGASPVVLPGEPHDEFVPTETGRDSETLSVEGPGDSEVSITSYAPVYRRGEARRTPTPIETFTSQVTGTESSGSAIRVSGSGLGIEEVPLPLPFLESEPTVSGDDVSLVLPAGARQSDGDRPFDARRGI